MYCRFCGARLPEDSSYCHRCGKAQEGKQRKGFNWWWLLLLLLGPLGWVALIFILLGTAVGNMSPQTRLVLGGFLFPPLWAPVIWTLRMPRWARVAVIAAVVAANSLWLHRLTGGWTAAAIALIVTVVLGLIWMTRAGADADAADRYLAGIRREVEEDLDACHDLIARIEDQLSLSPLPAGSALQRRYTHALEIRAEGAELLRAASTEQDMIAADRRIGRALDALESVSDDVTALPGPHTP